MKYHRTEIDFMTHLASQKQKLPLPRMCSNLYIRDEQNVARDLKEFKKWLTKVGFILLCQIKAVTYAIA